MPIQHNQFQSFGILEIWTILMVSTALWANSVDRLYIVLCPIHYFANHRKIVIVLMLTAAVIPVICIVTLTIVELTQPSRMVPRACL